MYTQNKTLKIKVCRLKIGVFYPGKEAKTFTDDVVGTHMDEVQAEKYVRKNFGAGYVLLSAENAIECVTLDIVKLYSEHMEEKNNE